MLAVSSNISIRQDQIETVLRRLQLVANRVRSSLRSSTSVVGITIAATSIGRSVGRSVFGWCAQSGTLVSVSVGGLCLC